MPEGTGGAFSFSDKAGQWRPILNTRSREKLRSQIEALRTDSGYFDEISGWQGVDVEKTWSAMEVLTAVHVLCRKMAFQEAAQTAFEILNEEYSKKEPGAYLVWASR